MTDEPVMDEKQLAARLFNGVWTLLEKEDRSLADDELMIHMAHASCYHWGQVGTPTNAVRGEWQCARVYATVRRAEPALYHARRSLELCLENGIGDFDVAFCYEALARAHAVAGEWEQVQTWLDRAETALQDVADAEDRQLVQSDLDTVPRPPP